VATIPIVLLANELPAGVVIETLRGVTSPVPSDRYASELAITVGIWCRKNLI
jgi:hypothetical protein